MVLLGNKKSGMILANADDDTTAVIRKIAVAAKQFEGKRINKIELAPLWNTSKI